MKGRKGGRTLDLVADTYTPFNKHTHLNTFVPTHQCTILGTSCHASPKDTPTPRHTSYRTLLSSHSCSLELMSPSCRVMSSSFCKYSVSFLFNSSSLSDRCSCMVMGTQDNDRTCTSGDCISESKPSISQTPNQ